MDKDTMDALRSNHRTHPLNAWLRARGKTLTDYAICKAKAAAGSAGDGELAFVSEEEAEFSRLDAEYEAAKAAHPEG